MDEEIKNRQKEILEETKLPPKILASDLFNERKNDKLRIAELEVRIKYMENNLNNLIANNNCIKNNNYSLKKEMSELIKYNTIIIDLLNNQIIENKNQTNEINKLLFHNIQKNNNIFKKLLNINNSTQTI